MPARRTTAVGPDGSPLPAEGGKEKLTFGCAFPGCGQTYSRMEYLKRHQRKHQDERPFQCKDCSKAFARSDVLLRHRRRCHPTPPPRDRSSHSPLPPPRAHPSVPISSSRTSEREASPLRGGRKHPRDSAESSHGEHPSGRARITLSEEDDEERYGSHFSRNGMGNGGVFGVPNYFSGNPNTDNSFHNMHDPNHLEDASVLLSMAYPGGVVPPNNSSPSSQRPADWEGDQTISMMMEAGSTGGATSTTPTTVKEKENSSEPNFNSGAVDNPARPAAPGALLPESMGNIGTMNWFANANDTSTWNLSSDSPRPPSPFNLSNFFSNAPIGLPGILTNETTAMAIAAAAAAAASSDTQSDSALAQANQVVASILDQLAMNDVPETKANPNPERPLLRLANTELIHRAGDECPRNSRFYLPADRFAGCYQIPHWGIPPLRTLSVMAARTYYTVLNHFSFVHEPTFQLIDTAACLAFAICTVGGIRTGNRRKTIDGSIHMLPGSNAPSPDVARAGLWESVGNNFAIGVDPEEQEDQRRLEEWDGGQVVRHEKTNMLVKSFSLAQGVLMTEYNVALLQALLLYHAPYFLSQIEQERRHANMFLGTIVSITRQIGFFLSELEHADTMIQLPKVPYTPMELETSWKHWVQLESRRRTAYLVYHLDTVSALESSRQSIITPSEVAAIPLPAPDSLWKAATADEWYLAAQSYRPITLDEALRRTLNVPRAGSFDKFAKGVQPTHANALDDAEYGPFARTAVILSLLRGIIDLGQGKRDRGDWGDLTDLWVSDESLRPSSTCISGSGADLGTFSLEALKGIFTLGLQRWHEGWQTDQLCTPSPTSWSPASVQLLTPLGNGSTPDSMLSDPYPKPQGKLVYCEEAMPFYFLAQALLTLYSPSVKNNHSFAKTRYSELLEASRALARAA